MAVVNPKLIYVPKTADEIRDAMLRDYRLAMLEQNGIEPAIAPGTEPYLRFQSIANNMLGLYANIEISANDASILDAQGTALDNLREAFGLPEKLAAPASGKLIVTITGGGTVTFADGLQFVTPNGLTGQVNGTQPAINGDTIDVVMVDAGLASNQGANTVVKWISTPLNSAGTAIVFVDGLTGGADDETDEEKRARIVEHLSNPPASGNWSFYVNLANASTAAVQQAFVYPALGGPGSLKVVVQKAMTLVDTATSDLAISLSRQVNTEVLQTVEDYIASFSPEPIEVVVQSVVDEDLYVTILLEAPTNTTNVSGWASASKWPKLTSVGEVVLITNIDGTYKQVTVSALTTTAPNIGDYISWYCARQGQFVTSKILSYSGSSGAWVLNLDIALRMPLSDGSIVNAAPGDFISPALTAINDYALTFLKELNKLGPGENTSDPNRDRAKRRPEATGSWPKKVSPRAIFSLLDAFPEIIDIDYGINLAEITEPTVPATVNIAPNIWNLAGLAFYSKE